jgi:glycosyltransferase involved in cell wall biosynthesis
MTGSYFAILTCRNSEQHIEEALLSLLKQYRRPTSIVVINDGSSDRTTDMIYRLKEDYADAIYVIDHPDWGYDISRLVKNWNEAIKFAKTRNLYSNTTYHLIATDDTVYPQDYARKIISFMDQRQDVVVASGNCANQKRSTTSPRGAGRFVRNSFLDQTLWKGYYPEQMGYESAILYEAIRLGFRSAIIENIFFEHIRPLGKNHSFYEFGASMRTLGYHPAFALARFLQCLITGNGTGRVGSLYMLYHYLRYRADSAAGISYDEVYPHEIIRVVRSEQASRIKAKIKGDSSMYTALCERALV